MDAAKMLKQMIEFQKTAFDNTFNAMVMIEGQISKFSDSLLGESSIIPKDAKNVINEWKNGLNKGRDDFKKTVDENFEKVEEFFSKSEQG